MRRRSWVVISSLVAGVLGAVVSFYMGYEGVFVFWGLSLAFPFAVNLLEHEAPLMLLVLPSVLTGFFLSLLDAFQPTTTVADALIGVFALPAGSFLLSWPGTLVIRYCQRGRKGDKSAL